SPEPVWLRSEGPTTCTSFTSTSAEDTRFCPLGSPLTSFITNGPVIQAGTVKCSSYSVFGPDVRTYFFGPKKVTLHAGTGWGAGGGGGAGGAVFRGKRRLGAGCGTPERERTRRGRRRRCGQHGERRRPPHRRGREDPGQEKCGEASAQQVPPHGTMKFRIEGRSEGLRPESIPGRERWTGPWASSVACWRELGPSATFTTNCMSMTVPPCGTVSVQFEKSLAWASPVNQLAFGKPGAPAPPRTRASVGSTESRLRITANVSVGVKSESPSDVASTSHVGFVPLKKLDSS